MLNYRTGPSVNYKILGTLKGADNKTYVSTKRDNSSGIYWYYIPSLKGWASGKYLSVSELKDPPKQQPGALKPNEVSAKGDNTHNVVQTSNSAGTSKGFDIDEMKKLGSLGDKYDDKLKVTNKIFGQPFQFDKSVDIRVVKGSGDKGGTGIGRRYTETFIAEGPVVSVLPGRSNFLPNVSKAERKQVEDSLISNLRNKSEDWIIKDLLNAETRYFDFTSDYVTYMNYVNLLCRASAIYMGIGDKEIMKHGRRKKLKYFDWTNYSFEAFMSEKEKEKAAKDDKNQGIFKKMVDVKDVNQDNVLKNILMGELNYVQFYVDPGTSFQESNSNQTGQSMLAGYANQAATMAKEIRFVGAASGVESALKSNPITNTMLGVGASTASAIGEMANLLTGGLLGKNRIINATKTMVGGGNIILPDIYQSSDYSKSYNLTVNLISPYGDPMSFYLHILVPLFHLMGFSLPRQVSANGYAHPFLVKLSSKGWFNCEMGMVDNISIEKVPGTFTVNGLPTEIRVQVSVRDLYSDLMLSPTTRPDLFFENRGLTNWLAVTSGVDVTIPSFQERWFNIVRFLLAGSIQDIPSNLYKDITQSVRNVVGLFIDFR